MSRARSYEAAIAFVRVADLDRTHAFYAGDLGLELVLDQGTCRIYRVAGGGHLGFCLADEAESARRDTWPNGLILTLVLADVEGLVADLQAAGRDVESGPRYNERYQIVQAFLRDPDGYLVEIQRFEDPRWSVP